MEQSAPFSKAHGGHTNTLKNEVKQKKKLGF